MTRSARFAKRGFDIVMSLIGLLLFWWLILLAYLLAAIDTGSNGFFIQKRVGRHGRLFRIIKIKTMKTVSGIDTSVTTADDVRITRFGRFLRKSKIDELPQLLNILVGNMSFVGPRPDVPGFADRLSGEDRIILSLRPGITGPATLKYRDEEELLAVQEDPERYNKEVIFPDKVAINKEYITSYSFKKDLECIFKTVFG